MGCVPSQQVVHRRHEGGTQESHLNGHVGSPGCREDSLLCAPIHALEHGP